MMENQRLRFHALLILLAAVLWLGLRGFTVQFLEGPYLQMATTNSIVLKWRTNQPAKGLLRFGREPGNQGRELFDSARLTEHELKIDGLAPGAKYYYSVRAPFKFLLNRAAGSEFFFRTLPMADAAQPVRIWAIGDSGTADQNAASVRDSYAGFSGARTTDVWLMLGDNAYPKGSRFDYERAFFAPFRNIARNTVAWPTLGNHDVSLANSLLQEPAYFGLFVLPENGEAGGLPSKTKSYYSFNYGLIHFVCLDSTQTNLLKQSVMINWLQRDLAASTDQNWLIAFWHHPPYSAGGHDSDLEPESSLIRSNALPVLEQYGADLVLAGHNHCYGRSFMLHGHFGVSRTFADSAKQAPCQSESGEIPVFCKPAARGPGEGTIYIVAGSSGQLDARKLDHPAMTFSLNVLGSCVIDVQGPRLDFKFLDSTGVVRDRFIIRKGPVGPPPRAQQGSKLPY